VRSWVIGICRRHAANHHRVVRRRREHICPEDDLDLVPARTPDNEAAYDARETTQVLFELIGALCPERREVVVAHEIEETPMSQIARMHHLGIHTAYNRLRLGRKDLRTGWQEKVR
jgi:RNA polymerase sigma factor (sigma-70 family)